MLFDVFVFGYFFLEKFLILYVLNSRFFNYLMRKIKKKIRFFFNNIS